MVANREVQRLEDENENWKRANQELCTDLDDAADIIKQLARLIAGWEHLPAVPAELRERAEEFGADFSG